LKFMFRTMFVFACVDHMYGPKLGAVLGLKLLYWVDNRGCAKLGHFQSQCTFAECNTIIKNMEILREISFYVN